MYYYELDKKQAQCGRPADIVRGMQPKAHNILRDRSAGSDLLATDLRSVAAQDRQAFEAVYLATVGRVLGLASRILGDTTAAEDVANEVYLQVWREADRFDPARGSAIAWIMTITRSRALDAMRRLATLATKTAELGNSAAEAEEQRSMFELLDMTHRESSLHRALQQLDGSDRQLLALAYFKGYTHAELAGITDQPLGTVKTRIRRTLMKLKELMAEECMEAGETA